MATELHAKVTEITSGTRYEDKIRRAKIEVDTKSTVWHNTIIIPDKENEYHLDRDLIVTVETFSENYERKKAKAEGEDEPAIDLYDDRQVPKNTYDQS